MDASWTPLHAAHLLNRAGFGGTPADVDRLYKLGKHEAVQSLLTGQEDSDLFPPPELTAPELRFEQEKSARTIEDFIERQKAQNVIRQQQNKEIAQLRGWWLDRMRYTPFPLREKMTLFWHGHFATSADKVDSSFLLWQQNETLRARALGNFRQLTQEISKDPAMMRYLDLTQSAKGRPNENFARELMELFTLGEGVRYTEKDVQESARAFTGYKVDPRIAQYRFSAQQHDFTTKTFLGRTGEFYGDDIIATILQQPECALFITRKVWRFLAGASLPPLLGKGLAQTFWNSGYQTSALVQAILLSPEFYSPEVMRRQVKSPVQWMVQNAITLETPMPPQGVTSEAMRQMGQVLFSPPNVKGWDGGNSWINGSTFLYRCNFAGDLVGSNNKQRALKVDWSRIAPPETRGNPEKLCDALAHRFISGPVGEKDRARFLAFVRKQPSPPSDAALANLVHLMMSTPEYQLA